MSCMMLIYTLLRSSMIQEFGRTLHLLDIHSSCLVMILSCFQAVKAGLLKILSKMGISLLSRYMFTDLLYNCSYKKRPIPGSTDIIMISSFNYPIVSFCLIFLKMLCFH